MTPANGAHKAALTIARLSALVGTWKGEGKGCFPTITSFNYTEECVFSSNDSEPLIHFEQRTWVKSTDETNGSPLHWESGFIRAIEDGGVEISNAQNGGRVEVLRGAIDETVCLEGILLLRLESVLFGNDPRLIHTTRKYQLHKNSLLYWVEMATTKTPDRQQHLEAKLERLS
ncbi:MAG TPA: FABP family protein [Pyrinomonadaceae bacterium]|nr:FABP family protein [Pyrinomonadaceae bacterium]